MKNLALKFGSVKEMLTKEQMKMISGGDTYLCYGVNTGTYGNPYMVTVSGDNCCQAQANCDSLAWSNSYSNQYPNGGNVPCDMAC